MNRPKRMWTVFLAVMALFASTAVAMAQEGEEEGDTVFNFGYDPENQVFVWGSSSTDGELDCTVEGEHEVVYLVLDGHVFVDELRSPGSTEQVSFPVRDDDEAAPVAYSAEGECGLSGGSVAGPSGQINHGMFLKLFNALYDGDARGCIVRHIARSSLGMGDQQVKVPDVDEDAQPVATGDTGTVDFTSVLTKCENGNGGGNGNGNGRPEWAGQGKPDFAGQGKPPWAGKPGGPNGNGGGSDD